MTEGRRERFRPSSIQLLPPEADGDVAWALDQVITRESMTQRAVLKALNERLVDRGLAKTTESSFNRLVVQFRNEGIPDRYRLSNIADGSPGAELDPLLALIDRRIEAALARRGLAARA